MSGRRSGRLNPALPAWGKSRKLAPNKGAGSNIPATQGKQP